MDSLLLVRHALAGSNRDRVTSCTAPGEGLTAEGIEQAERLRTRLAREEISLGIATELVRTQETLELVLGDRAVPRLVLPELNEIDFGEFEAGPLDRYRAWAASHSPAEPPPGGGESRAAAAARFAAGVRIVLARSEERVLVVGHSVALRYVLDAARGLVPASLMSPVEHAAVHRLAASDVESAALLLEQWSRAPRFRTLREGE